MFFGEVLELGTGRVDGVNVSDFDGLGSCQGCASSCGFWPGAHKMRAASTRPRTRRQHYVPACYLSHFAWPNARTGRLWVFDRQTGARRPSTPGSEAHSRDFYAVELESRDDANIAEDELAKLESIFAPAISRVNETSGLPAEIRPLMAFIAMQFVRTPSARAWFDKGRGAILMALVEETTQTWERFLPGARKIWPDANDEELGEAFSDIRECLRPPGARITMDQTTLIGDAFNIAPAIEDELAERCWLLGIAPEDAPRSHRMIRLFLTGTVRATRPIPGTPGSEIQTLWFLSHLGRAISLLVSAM
jgi:hypothetical protein